METDDIYSRAIAVDQALNKKYAPIPVGNLLYGVIGTALYGKKQTRPFLKVALSMSKYYWLSIFKAKNYHHFDKKILFVKNADKFHFNRIIDPLHEAMKEESLLYVATKKDNRFVDKFYQRLNPLTFIKIYLFIKNETKEILKVFKAYGLDIQKELIPVELLSNLCRYYNWKKILKGRKLELVVVDADKGGLNSFIICAANDLGIQTVTLQHGSVDQTFGYYPLIANEMWSWGKHTSEVMIAAGLSPEKIKKVGNPVATGRSVKTEGEFHKVIGFSLSGSHLEHLEKEIVNKVVFHPDLEDFSFVIKLRPSVKATPWMTELPRTTAYETGKEADANINFFKKIDLMVVMISSIGYEAMDAGVPLWVHKVMDSPIFMDHIMIDKGKCPDIGNPEVLSTEAAKLRTGKADYLKNLLAQEEAFLRSDYYHASGEEATENMLKLIKEKIST